MKSALQKDIPFGHLLWCGMLLSCPAKKVTKECDIGEALRKCGNYGMIAGGNHTTSSAFSECPLKSPSFGTFLGEARKVHSLHLTITEIYGKTPSHSRRDLCEGVFANYNE